MVHKKNLKNTSEMNIKFEFKFKKIIYLLV
jgi:hypothetical protein